MTRYATLAAILSQRIQQGLYPAGHRLPSVRALSQEHGVSISTVQQAYRLLEEQRLVEARPKSGYFVHTRRAQAELPAMTAPVQRPVDISQWEQVLELVRSRPREGLIQLGRGMPDIAEPTMKPLIVALRNAARHGDLRSLYYDSIQGVAALREQVARLLLDSGCQIGPDQLLITTGCQEAISAGLRAVCQPGDIVAVDSPCFHGTMQTLKGLGIKALEIPTDPLTGVSLAALEMALEQWPIKAILLTPNCNNPLGYIMPDAHKQRLLTLAQRHDAAIIEDDVYGDIAYHYPRPRTIKSFDEDGRVLLCSSFSKTLAPGLRVGWIAPGRYLERVLHMKFIGSGATATQPQLAIAEFIRGGHYLQHLRRMRTRYQQNRDRMTDLILKHFPAGTRVSRPRGGFMLWIELDEAFDTLRLNRHLEQQGVQIAVGSIFSAAGKYRNCLRINYAPKLTAEIEQAVQRVGATILALMPSGVLQPQAD
ncbi:PLP-dependent aminotransferase family protein [Serratia marcescens]|uniref:aminotransferase-like domain-containing protein n=1 Tax=Serratia TaxID=613 RepID=UPI0007453AA0|nr:MULTISPECIES: PLP-dependent aminotransferase family protein [Serratia]AWC76030.1 PLP-dependent aminotransferase family protein [Serratia marcescens]EIJ6699270.1 PLP-dependent aminotransferase family protein [Serratia marcescens]EIV5185254.1 PLP-dependent aminotransferase family protein [Serratia marcescens]EIY2711990.1 PLP-dependent aminotransferase family protein [Serratia marcescens]ELD1855328.1 PLP-dependent aminotransferase family protein [Serratia marcescens]